MPGKRRRIENPNSAAASSAARLKALRTENVDSTTEYRNVSPGADPVSDLSDYEDKESVQSDPVVRQNVQLCTWRYGQDHVSSESEEQLTVFLEKNATISLIGCYDLVVLKGAVNINGANLTAGARNAPVAKHRIYMPSTHPISCIRGLDKRNEIQFLDCKEPTPFKNISPLFASIWSAASQPMTYKRSFALISDSDSDPLNRPIAPELAPEEWVRQVEECASGSGSLLISGIPASGKSIFARRILNRYLTGLGKSAPALPAVYYLDLDSINPTYTPHGQISLVMVREPNLGPSFTRPYPLSDTQEANQMICTHALPVSDLSNHYDYFLACVEHLFQVYTSLPDHKKTPLIIDTPSWVFTPDTIVLLDILTRTKPSRLLLTGHLESIDETNAAKMDIIEVFARKNGITVDHIPAQYSLNTLSHTALQLRSMHMLSYFHCTGSTNATHHSFTYNAKPLSHTAPWEFYYEETEQAQQAFIGFLMLGDWSESSQISKFLNGSLIQIVETEDEAVSGLYKSLPRTNKYRIPYFEKGSDGSISPLDPKSSRFICTALLRGWDPENRAVQLLVPKPFEASLQRLRPKNTVFISGCCEHPEWAFTEPDYHRLSQSKDSNIAAVDTKRSGASPWIAPASTVENMGYMYTTRRVRKFQQ